MTQDPNLDPCRTNGFYSALGQRWFRKLQALENKQPQKLTVYQGDVGHFQGTLGFKQSLKPFPIEVRSSIPFRFKNFFTQNIDIFQVPGSDLQIARIRTGLDTFVPKDPALFSWFGDIYVRLGKSSRDSCVVGAHQLASSHQQVFEAGYSPRELSIAERGQLPNGSIRTSCIANCFGTQPELINSNIVLDDILKSVPECGPTNSAKVREQFVRAPRIPRANRFQPIRN